MKTVNHSYVMRLSVLLLVFHLIYTSASGVSASEKGSMLHGYGEMHYSNPSQSDKSDKMDYHRFVLGLTHQFNERTKLVAEIDFEHAAQELELEMAFIDFSIMKEFNVRVGSVLVPVGYLNEFHEPTRFYSVERPYVHKNIIPTSWTEGGAGIFGSFRNGLQYRAYVVNSLDGINFTAGSGIRKGRHKVSEAPSSNMALTGRVEYTGMKGIQAGLSAYAGNAGQNNSEIGDVGVTILETDARWRLGGLELLGMYTRISINDTDRIFIETNEVVGSRLEGLLAEAAYHLDGYLFPENQKLVLFARHEIFDTQKDVEDGLSADPANDRNVTTAGVAYYPIEKIAVKCDYETWNNGKSETWHQLNIGIGFMY